MKSFLLLFTFFAFAHSFKKVFVLFVDDNAYVDAIFKKGELAEHNYGLQTSTIVSHLKEKEIGWKIYSEKYNRCQLDQSIAYKYSHIIDQTDINNSGCSRFGNAISISMNLAAHNLPRVSFYFPANESNPEKIRKMLYPVFSSPEFLTETLTMIISRSKNGATSSVLLLGKDAQNPGRGQPFDREALLFAPLREYGFYLTASQTPPSNKPWFDRIFYVLMENQPITKVLKYQSMRNLAVQGTLLTEFNALINPSQPNYIGLVAGTMMGIKDDDPHDLNGRFIVDLLEEKGVSWKAYMEDYPGNCYNGRTHDRYVRKHNPFMSFVHVRANETLCNKIVNSEQLHVDVKNNELPKYTFYTPNMDNDGHDTGLRFSSKWLEGFLAPLLQSQNFMDRTLVVATYDEGIFPDNKIYTLLLGDMIPFGSLDNTSYSTYSLLRTTEEHLSLNSLETNDLNATLIDPSLFYPGELPPVEVNPYLFVGLGAGFFVAIGTVGGTLLYFKKFKKSKLDRIKLQNTEAEFSLNSSSDNLLV